jgi:uncharacterized protein YcfJ
MPYPNLRIAVGAVALALAGPALAEITFYEGEGFRGRAFTTDHQVPNLQDQGFNDRASSVVVGSGRWEVCVDSRFHGRCVLLRQGSYDSLRGLGLNDRISSVRQVDRHYAKAEEAPDPMPEPNYPYRRRPYEPVFQAPVNSVHAVMGPPEQRCWVEREQVQGSNQPNVGGAVLGALIGGVLGHQVGGGRGNSLATAGGAVAGAAIGARAGDGGGPETRDVRRCEAVAGGPPAYWDVGYNFRGVEHRVQMSAAPGPTVAVNEAGEPRQ